MLVGNQLVFNPFCCGVRRWFVSVSRYGIGQRFYLWPSYTYSLIGTYHGGEFINSNRHFRWCLHSHTSIAISSSLMLATSTILLTFCPISPLQRDAVAKEYSALWHHTVNCQTVQQNIGKNRYHFLLSHLTIKKSIDKEADYKLSKFFLLIFLLILSI